MARRKKKNPSALIKVAGVLFVGGLIGYGVYQAVKKPVPKPKKTTPEAVCAASFDKGTKEYETCVATAKGEQKSESQAKKQGKYVGTGWKDWPHKDVFKDEQSFGDVIVSLGYAVGTKFPDEPGWSARDPGFIAAVKEFQSDWNLVIQYAVEMLEAHIGVGIVNFVPLGVDGKIGNNTAKALYRAYLMDEDPESSETWQDIVSEAVAQKKAAQS